MPTKLHAQRVTLRNGFGQLVFEVQFVAQRVFSLLCRTATAMGHRIDPSHCAVIASCQPTAVSNTAKVLLQPLTSADFLSS